MVEPCGHNYQITSRTFVFLNVIYPNSQILHPKHVIRQLRNYIWTPHAHHFLNHSWKLTYNWTHVLPTCPKLRLPPSDCLSPREYFWKTGRLQSSATPQWRVLKYDTLSWPLNKLSNAALTLKFKCFSTNIFQIVLFAGELGLTWGQRLGYSRNLDAFGWVSVGSICELSYIIQELLQWSSNVFTDIITKFIF